MSITKKYFKEKKVCQTTFKVDTSEMDAPGKVFLVGEFNNWDLEATRMRKGKDGIYSVSLKLPFGTIHQFRYLIDGNVWENDDSADDYVPSPFDSDNSVVIIDSE